MKNTKRIKKLELAVINLMLWLKEVYPEKSDFSDFEHLEDKVNEILSYGDRYISHKYSYFK